eukprot:631286-Rhodomonas_salina.2
MLSRLCFRDGGASRTIEPLTWEHNQLASAQHSAARRHRIRGGTVSICNDPICHLLRSLLDPSLEPPVVSVPGIAYCAGRPMAEVTFLREICPWSALP